MATVTVFTAERMQEIEDNAIIGGEVDGSGHLILETHDGTFIDAGPVVAAAGTPFIGQYTTIGRPSAVGLDGKIIWDITEAQFYKSDGTDWELLPIGISEPFVGQYETADRPPAGDHTDKVLWDTDVKAFFESDGTDWNEIVISGGAVASVVPGFGVDVDSSDPANPVVSADTDVAVQVDLDAINAALAAHEAEGPTAHPVAFDNFAQELTLYSPKSKRTHFVIDEDFVGGTTTSGQIGQYGWTFLVVNGTPTLSHQLSDFDDPGVINLSVTALNTTGALLLDPFLMPDGASVPFIFEARVRINQVNAGTEDVSMRFGVAGDSTASRPASGAWFEHVTGGTVIDTCTREASGTTQVNGISAGTGFTLNNSWHTYTIIGDGGGNVDFFIDDDGTYATPLFTHNVVPTSNITPRLTLTKSVSSASTSRTMRVGYVYLRAAVVR